MKDYQYLNSLRRSRNQLLEAMPKALGLAKKTQNKFVRSKSLKLYFDQKRRLADIEATLKREEQQS